MQYDSDLVEIFHDHERIACHKRDYRPGKYTTVKEHMPSSHRAYTEWSPGHFAERAAKVGPGTAQYITRLIAQYAYPEQAYKQALGILSLTKTYPPERVEAACKYGLEHHRSSYRIIENILKNHQQQAAAQIEVEKPFPQEEELAKKSARLAELNAQLDVDEKNHEPEQEEEPDEDAPRRPSVLAALEEKSDKPEPVKPFRSYYDKDGDAR